MKSLMQWAVRNSPAMNTLMVAVLAVGILTMVTMRREVFPEFELEIILVTVPYPGASPEEVEEGICQKIEEAVQSIAGIKKQTAVAQEGSGFLVLELESHVRDVHKVLSEVRSNIDRIPSLPELAEDPEVKQITIRQPAIMVGVVGTDSEAPDAELRLRELAEKIRTDLLQQPSISQATLVGARNYQIDVEIPESTLRKHGLTLKQVAQIIRRENIEVPGGSLKSESQEVLLRAKNKHTTGEMIGDLPLVTQPGGMVLTVSDLAEVRDEFVDVVSVNEINGRPGLTIAVEKTSQEDLLKIVEEVKDYIANKEMPPGHELVTWGDRSVEVRERLEMIADNGVQGLVLVFILLALFLDIRLAFWVAWGIPMAMFGAFVVLGAAGQTLNMLSMYAFLIVMGMGLDDAIVIGENIFEHRQQGKSFYNAAIDGAMEVLPSVLSSVLTAVTAFIPLAFVSGVMGKFIAVMPLAVVATLLVSLAESMFMLPVHLSHLREGDIGDDLRLVTRARKLRSRWNPLLGSTLGLLFVAGAYVAEQIAYPFQRIGVWSGWLNRHCVRFLDGFIERCYLPALRFSLDNPGIMLSGAFCLILMAVGLVRSGYTPYILFPKIDANVIEAMAVYPEGTPSSVPAEATKRLEAAILRVNERHEKAGQPVMKLWRRAVGHVTATDGVQGEQNSIGSHLGGISVELVESSQRDISSQELIREWREEAGEFPGVEKLTYRSPSMGPGGTPIEFKLLADRDHFAELERAVEECKTQLAGFPGIFDVADDSRPGKWEFQIRIKEKARAMGVQLADLADTVRGAYYGEEVMRLQRGRHEVKLMVRYPPKERSTLADFDNIYVRLQDGAERPLTELADVTVLRGNGEINRDDQLRSNTMTADGDEADGNASNTDSEQP
ncbi:MAG: efflux RND transporter permease subunit, partial [Planctomycetaceae bacterium]